jgi:flagellar assembly factor FliW
MQIDTTRFGPIEIDERALIQFPRGLYGLEDSRAYCLLEHGSMGCFQWLQAADAPAIALVVTNPFQFFPEYQVEIPDPAAELIQATKSTEVAIYTTLTIVADERRVFTNLLGPIAVNHEAGLGLQIIQDATLYQTRHELPLLSLASLSSGADNITMPANSCPTERPLQPTSC